MKTKITGNGSVRSFMVHTARPDDIHSFYPYEHGHTIEFRTPTMYGDAGDIEEWSHPEIDFPPRKFRITIEEIVDE